MTRTLARLGTRFSSPSSPYAVVVFAALIVMVFTLVRPPIITLRCSLGCGPHRSDTIYFKDMARIYLETYAKPNKRSWTRDETCIKNLSPYFAHKYLHEITPLDIEHYKKERVRQVTPRTVNIEVKFLKALYNKAISWGKADKNPMNEVKLFREDSGRVRYLEKDEISRLVRACPDHLRPIVITALNTGMRKREILDLKWDDIDLGQKTIYIISAKSE